jgi:hypothetical protein
MPSEPIETNSDDIYEKGLNALREAIDRNLDLTNDLASRLDRTLISLSAGAILLSTTFVPIFAPRKLWLPLLFGAWLSFVFSILFVIFATRSLLSAIERSIRKAADALNMIEKNPMIARQFIAEQQKPITLKQITTHAIIGRLNLCAP